MKIPVVQGVIDRRLLINFRVEPRYLAEQLPAPFRPQLVRGFGIAGVCLIRLKRIRPRFLPGAIGISSENAAHRIAVEWDTADGVNTGVYIPRRDTSSWLNVQAGGRLFPGVHHRASFTTQEQDAHYRLHMRSVDSVVELEVDACVSPTRTLPDDSVFASVEETSEFFRSGSLGYSPSSEPNRFDGLELRSKTWNVEPLTVQTIRSSWFDDRSRFPEGTVQLDNALLMRHIDHEWHQQECLCSRTAAVDAR